DDLPASAWKFGSYKGKTFGIPAVEGFIRWGLAANEELLGKQGLDPTKLPATWEELLEWHKRLTVMNGSAIQQLGIDPPDAPRAPIPSSTARRGASTSTTKPRRSSTSPTRRSNRRWGRSSSFTTWPAVRRRWPSSGSNTANGPARWQASPSARRRCRSTDRG